MNVNSCLMQQIDQDLRAILQSHGNGVSVDTTHEEPEKTADSKELLKGSRVYGCNLEKSQNDHVKNHRVLSTKLI